MQQNPESQYVTEQLANRTRLVYLLVGDLRDLLSEQLDCSERKWVSAILDALVESLHSLHELKARGGYMQEVIDERPCWANRVRHLQDEYRRLYSQLQNLQCMIGVCSDEQFGQRVESIQRELRDWMMWFVSHERHESRLLQTAFLIDVGGGD